jgi:hypothetical protein
MSCAALVVSDMRSVPTPNEQIRRARLIASMVGPDDLVVSMNQFKLFVLHEWHRLGFDAEVISFPPQHDRQLCWNNAESELADPASIASAVADVTERISDASAAGRRAWILIHGEPAGARWEVDRQLFARLQELGYDVQPVGETLGLAELVR